MQVSKANIRTSYKSYAKNRECPLKQQEFVSIANGYMKFLSNKILEGEEVSLPAKLGTIFIVGKKKPLSFSKVGLPRLPPDWVKTKKLWENNPEAKAQKKLVYHLNESTGGVVYKIQWSRRKVFMENKTLYSLRMTRANKRAVHHKIKEGKEYIINDCKIE